LGIRRTANVLWNGEEHFDFRVVPSAEDLDAVIKQRAAAGNSARLVAGYCWPWSNPDSAGRLVEDVVIGNWKRPWNARPDAGRLAAGIPPAPLWAHDPGGMGQVGCVYTAQGFEFDYVGVIWGPDLVYRFDENGWVGNRAASHDGSVKRSGERFIDLVKNTYRVLLSRGLKGCYVYFMDKETERFVLSRIEALNAADSDLVQRQPVAIETEPEPVSPTLRKLTASAVRPYENSVPLIDLAIAAGQFSHSQLLDPDQYDWVELPSHFRPQRDLFVAKIFGESMNRRIPIGSWCLFRLNPSGTRQGKVVVAQHPGICDPDLGGSFTVKVYRSEKVPTADGSWRHVRVILSPDSTKEFQDIVIENPSEMRIVAEFLAVLD